MGLFFVTRHIENVFWLIYYKIRNNTREKKMSKIVIVGSINADLVFVTDKRPESGSTVMGKKFSTIPGGKGANQAVAASRLGGHVSMIGLVGKDIFGDKMIDNLRNNDVSTIAVEQIDSDTGTAGIIVDSKDNSIVVIPGANSELDINYIKKHEAILKEAEIVVIQLEIPMNTVEYVVDFCRKFGIKTILNPAPSQTLSKTLIDNVTYITPNEHEAKEMLGHMHLEDMLKSYPNKLIVTLGDKGVIFFDGKTVHTIPVEKVDALDTTGAGDTFNGALAYALTKENTLLIDAVKFASKAATISVTKHGAQGGMPTQEELERWS